MGDLGVLHKKCIEVKVLGEKGRVFAIGLQSGYFGGVNLDNYTIGYYSAKK